MNSSTPEFQFDDRPPVLTSLSAVTVADAKNSSRKLYIKWPCPRILSSSNQPLFLLPLLVVDPGNTQLHAGHGEASIFYTHLFGLSCPPLDPPSSSPSDTCATAQASCSMIEGLSLVGSIEGVGESVLSDFKLCHYVPPFSRRSERACQSDSSDP